MDTVHMGFLIAAINHLDICAADIGNAFLVYGKTREKVYIVAGQELQNPGANLIIERGSTVYVVAQQDSMNIYQPNLSSWGINHHM